MLTKGLDRLATNKSEQDGSQDDQAIHILLVDQLIDNVGIRFETSRGLQARAYKRDQIDSSLASCVDNTGVDIVIGC